MTSSDGNDEGGRPPTLGDRLWEGLEAGLRGLGLATPRTLFKIRQARARQEEKRAARANLERGVAYTHKACPACGRLVTRGASRCPYCDANVRWASGPGLARALGLSLPHGSVAMTLVGVNLLLFGVTTVATARGMAASGSGGPVDLLVGALMRPDGRVLFNMGALSGLPIFLGEVWRLWTYQFLHFGALHIGFNLFALFSLGPTTEDVYGPSKMAVLYWVTGTLAGVTTLGLRILLTGRVSVAPMTVGASGAIFGLIGLLIGHSTRRGGAHAAQLRPFLVRWAIYGLVMGLLIGADNAAHVGGLAAGLALGLLVPEGEPNRGPGVMLWRLGALGAALLTVGGFLGAALSPHA